MSDYYTLDKDNNIIPCSIIEYSIWSQTNNNMIKRTVWPAGERVSTVFLGLDHSFGGVNRGVNSNLEVIPILFETMIFGFNSLGIDEDQYRYSIYEESLLDHDRIVDDISKRASQNFVLQEVRINGKIESFPGGYFPKKDKDDKDDTIQSRFDILDL